MVAFVYGDKHYLFDLYLTFHTLGYCKLLCRKSKFQWLNTYLFYCFLEIVRRVSAGGNAEKSLNGGSKENWKNRPAICLSLDCSPSYSWNDSSSTWKLSAMTKHQKGIVPIILLVDGSSISSFRKPMKRVSLWEVNLKLLQMKFRNPLHMLQDFGWIPTWYGWYWLRSWYLRKEKELFEVFLD